MELEKYNLCPVLIPRACGRKGLSSTCSPQGPRHGRVGVGGETASKSNKNIKIAPTINLNLRASSFEQHLMEVPPPPASSGMESFATKLPPLSTKIETHVQRLQPDSIGPKAANEPQRTTKASPRVF